MKSPKNEMVRKIRNEILCVFASLREKIFLFIFFCSFFQYSFSQKDDTLKSEDIEIINVYEPVISDAFKVLETPKIVDTTPPPINVKYDLLKRQLKTEFHIDTIKAATMKSESLSKLYNSFVKIGGGNNFISLVDASYHNLRSREQSFGTRLKHFGAYNPVNGSPFSGFSENELKLYGTKFLDDYAVSAELGHSRDVIHFYGFNTEDFPNIIKDNVRQRYATTSAKAGMMSFYKDSAKINYDTKFTFYNLYDSYKAQENNVVLSGDLHRFWNKEKLVLFTSLDYNNYKNPIQTLSNAILKIHPQIVSQGKNWAMNFGFGIFMDAGSTAKFYFKPIAEFKYKVVSDLIVPYAGVTGNVVRNSYKSFTDENPFVMSSLNLQNTNQKIQAYAGIRGAESSEISFNIMGSMMLADSMPLYVIDTTYLPQNKFSVVYDNAIVNNIRAEITYQKEEKLKILFSGDYFSYDPTIEDTAWYKPQFKANISAQYNLQDKIILKAALFGIANQFAKTYDSNDIATSTVGVYKKELPGIIDANIGAEYRYNKRLSAFINLNNLGNMRYYRWLNYPMMRFNAVGGISYSF